MNALIPLRTRSLPKDHNPAVVYVGSLVSQHSRSAMTNALAVIVKDVFKFKMVAVQDFAWEHLRYQHTVKIRTELIKLGRKPAGINLILAALRGVLKECWKLNLMSSDDYHRAADIPNVRDQTLPAGRELSEGEIAALFLACNGDDSPAGTRDGAIIALLRACALRRSELAALRMENYHPDTGQLEIRHGKGGKERVVFVPLGAQAYLHLWLAVRGDSEGALFCPINKGDKIHLRALSAQSVYDVLRKRATQAGVKSFSPHDFRRTFAGDMLDAGADIATVAGMMGHSTVITTQRYDRRGLQARKKAAELIHIPAPDALL